MKISGLSSVLEHNKESFKKAYYSCGSRHLSHWLMTEKGLFPVDTYIHKNGKLISIFVVNDDLSSALTEWSNNRPQK